MQALTELKATGLLAIGTFGWTATVALAQFGPDHLWDSSQTALSWAAVVLNLAAGFGWIATFMRYLRAVDELERKIMLDALAITLGVAWVSGFAYIVADAADLVARELDVAALAVLMSVVFVGSIAVGRFRYR
ncbi:hypothetical protein ACTI_52820 [Actinoplanes sp. OR16]|uniref:hypothetical protein n=1 Tax=Actinoplanes sp. OR16 TaxID=946334 RepID=UPI000F70CC31|nr:hypothetical protein [Actinoplanes sp. OR16]BBH68597.1 hypothetical protein ACTI_52820 [Actinoplanes sp. OR16]